MHHRRAVRGRGPRPQRRVGRHRPHRLHRHRASPPGFQDVGNSLSLPGRRAHRRHLRARTLRYANSPGGDGQNTTRTLTVTVDGGAGADAHAADDRQLGHLGDRDRRSLDLTAGTPHGRRSRAPRRDSGNVNIDSLALVTPGAAYPAPAAAGTAVLPFGTRLRGRDRRARRRRDRSPPTTTATPAPASSPAWRTGGERRPCTSPASRRAGTYALQLRYANAQPARRRTGLGPGRLGGGHVGHRCPPTSSWDTWRTVAVPVTLTAGNNDVTLGCPTGDSCQRQPRHRRGHRAPARRCSRRTPRSAATAAASTASTARRVTTPGLLYQDGWSLLDDTAVGALRHRRRRRSPRGRVTAAQPYQDGYVFGYGHDYQQGADATSPR